MCAVCAVVIRFVITENGLKSDYMNNYILWLFQWAVRVPFSCCLFSLSRYYTLYNFYSLKNK